MSPVNDENAVVQRNNAELMRKYEKKMTIPEKHGSKVLTFLDTHFIRIATSTCKLQHSCLGERFLNCSALERV